jgi:hypothetical protein
MTVLDFVLVSLTALTDSLLPPYLCISSFLVLDYVFDVMPEEPFTFFWYLILIYLLSAYY